MISLISCKNRNKTDENNPQIVVNDEMFATANKEAVRKENIQIDDFIRRYKWEMTTSNTGIRYQIYEHGRGVKTKKGDIVTLDYTITFLNGDTVYSSKTEGNKEFMIDKSNEVSGLEEALLLMNQGDRAKLIVPSFRAYGITGDFNKISVKNTLVYDVYLLRVN